MIPSSAELQRVKGTIDALPEQQRIYENITETCKRLFNIYGFSQVRVPVIEYSEVFERKSGDELLQKMYEFKDRFQRKICLRPDLTASIARAYVNKWRSFPKPSKLWYVGPAYRYDEPQRGRYREFYHIGVEFIGADSPVVDAELISLAVDIVRNLHLKRWRLRLGHLGFFLGYLNQLRKKMISKATSDYEREMTMDYIQARLISRVDLLKGNVSEIEKGLLKDGVESADFEPATNFLAELNKLKGSEKDILPKLERLCKKHSLPMIWLDNLKQIIALLDKFGVDPEELSLDMGITRGLTYYTGMVFEVDVPTLGSQKQICGGGRYDQLIEILGGTESTPAAGFAFGLERLGLALQRKKKYQKVKGPVDVFVAYVSDDVLDYAIQVLQFIRRNGIKANLEYRGRKVKASLSYANIANIPYVIVVGSKEKRDQSVTLRNMFAKKEVTLSLESAVQMLRKETTGVNNIEG